MIGIYKIVNIQNNFLYIGSAININRRWNYHKSYLKRNKHFNKKLQNAWNKYGEENFQFEIVEECEKEKLIEREQYWIDFTKSCGKKGYNLRPNAKSNLGLKCKEKNRIYFSKLYKGRYSGENHFMVKFNWEIVRDMRYKYEVLKMSQNKIAKIYNTSRSTIQSIVNYRRWKEEIENNKGECIDVSN